MPWENTGPITPKQYRCGHCNSLVGSNIGYIDNSLTNIVTGHIYICSFCNYPTFFSFRGIQIPGVLFGDSIQHLPDDVANLYDEARRCMSVSSYTSAVMVCRKLLMHIAVEKGADENRKFIDYVDWLQEKNYIPPNGKSWVDYIRQKGNEANHEISLMEKEDAEGLIKFLGMLMKVIYEFPSSIPGREDTEKPS